MSLSINEFLSKEKQRANSNSVIQPVVVPAAVPAVAPAIAVKLARRRLRQSYDVNKQTVHPLANLHPKLKAAYPKLGGIAGLNPSALSMYGDEKNGFAIYFNNRKLLKMSSKVLARIGRTYPAAQANFQHVINKIYKGPESGLSYLLTQQSKSFKVDANYRKGLGLANKSVFNPRGLSWSKDDEGIIKGFRGKKEVATFDTDYLNSDKFTNEDRDFIRSLPSSGNFKSKRATRFSLKKATKIAKESKYFGSKAILTRWMINELTPADKKLIKEHDASDGNLAFMVHRPDDLELNEVDRKFYKKSNGAFVGRAPAEGEFETSVEDQKRMEDYLKTRKGKLKHKFYTIPVCSNLNAKSVNHYVVRFLRKGQISTMQDVKDELIRGFQHGRKNKIGYEAYINRLKQGTMRNKDIIANNQHIKNYADAKKQHHDICNVQVPTSIARCMKRKPMTGENVKDQKLRCIINADGGNQCYNGYKKVNTFVTDTIKQNSIQANAALKANYKPTVKAVNEFKNKINKFGGCVHTMMTKNLSFFK